MALAHPEQVRHNVPMMDAETNETARFFLQAIDADLGCPVLEAVFDVADLDELRAVLERP